MLRIFHDANIGPFSVGASVAGLPIYLDNHSFLSLAKGDPARQNRFIEALKQGADLLFSITNAAEIIGPQGRSAELLRGFLDRVGPRWFPIELDPQMVATRETQGITGGEAIIATDFMKQYFAVLTKDHTPGSGKVIDLSEGFFRLSAVLDWLGPQRNSIRAKGEQLDAALINKIEDYRGKHDRDDSWLNKNFPQLPFNPRMPGTFTYINVIRGLVLDARSYHLKKNDGIDFCHAVIGAAFASFATLDKHWKRRIEALPKPNQLATIYYGPQLDQLISDVERAVELVRRARGQLVTGGSAFSNSLVLGPQLVSIATGESVHRSS